MIKQSVMRIALPTPLRRLFDYLAPQAIDPKALKPGVRVTVPFQSRTLTGILIDVSKESAYPLEKLKTIAAVLDEEPVFTKDIFELCQWASDYYHYPLGEILANALPTLLRKGKQAAVKPKKNQASAPKVSASPPLLNPAQEHAVKAINGLIDEFNVFLLDGVTGSGKTEVYLQVIATLLSRGKQVLVLVPEISLTPQTIARFRHRFSNPVVALHSNLSETERLRGWLAAREGQAAIIIGTRSAVFTPFKNLGLIIVDEEHDTAFKQQDRFRYHGRDLAVMRASLNRIPVVLGSATPSLESLLNVERQRYRYLSLPLRAGQAMMPTFQVINTRNEVMEEGLSATLLSNLRTHLDAGNQVLLFLNRRGFSPVLYCTQCAFMAECSRCDARMVYHASPKKLQCHHCDFRMEVPIACPTCKEKTLQPVGLGTQRLEQALAEHFKEVPIIRIDRDNTQRKGAMQALLSRVETEKKAILLGTQMLAKGHHFENVTLVGVVDADSGLFSSDFRAAEQLGQLLVQVAGRAGRAEKPGTVVIQTRHPEHPLLQLLLTQGYNAFARALLTERQSALMPPFVYFAVFRVEAYNEKVALTFLNRIKEIAPLNEALSLLGPTPALLTKKKGLYCQHLLVRAGKRQVLQQFLQSILAQLEKIPERLQVKWILEVDPIEV